MNGSTDEWLRTVVVILSIAGILGGGMYFLISEIRDLRTELRHEITTNRSELREDLGKLDDKVDKLLENSHDNEKRIVRLETLAGIEPETNQNQ